MEINLQEQTVILFTRSGLLIAIILQGYHFEA